MSAPAHERYGVDQSGDVADGTWDINPRSQDVPSMRSCKDNHQAFGRLKTQ